MKKLTAFFALATLLMASGIVFAQDAGGTPPHGRYVVLPPKGSNNAKDFAGTLQTWPGSIQYKGTNYPFVMVGTDPSKTNTTTTVNVYIVPVKICVTSNGVKSCFDPATVQPNGATATQNVVNSPIFQNQDYTIGGTDLGKTQYEDAFQRGNFWTSVMTNTSYHVLLKPIVLPEVTVNVPTADGSLGFQYGINEALVDINYLDGLIINGLSKLKQVNPTNLALIETYNTYLTSGGCCIGGYHSASGNQSYSHFTYISANASFAEDVSALSHELGEWLDDPLTNGGNNSPCGILEDGDPIEGEGGTHHYGDYTYTLNGFTYHLQDLATTQYFGQTPSQSNNGDWTFQGQTGLLPGLGTIGVCSFGS